jgi:uroporphyrin-III C-methyltransferase
LKGGDPFIFGRGAEELDYVRAYNIETAIVPGISSALAVPAYQGIPLTKRGIAESFRVITGTTKAQEISTDVALAAQSNATVAILMGMSQLSEIVSAFAKAGKEKIPVAIIQNGTREDEKAGFGTIETIEKVVQEKELSSPAVIVIGSVVGHRSVLSKKVTSIKDAVYFKNKFRYA